MTDPGGEQAPWKITGPVLRAMLRVLGTAALFRGTAAALGAGTALLFMTGHPAPGAALAGGAAGGYLLGRAWPALHERAQDRLREAEQREEEQARARRREWQPVRDSDGKARCDD